MKDFFPLRREGGVQGQHLLVGHGGPGGVAEGVMGLTPDVTDHIRRS